MSWNLSLIRRIAAAGVVAALLLSAVPGAASAAVSCPLPPTTQAFAAFGDTADYFLAPGGGFEGALTWSRSGLAAQVAGNEPFMLAGPHHAWSMRLRTGGRVTSPKLCVTPDLPHLRFVAQSSGSGQLDVEVRVYGADGKVTDSSSGSVSPSDHVVWAPSRPVDLNTDELEDGESGYVDVTFRSQGDWRVDDVFIDPYKRG